MIQECSHQSKHHIHFPTNQGFGAIEYWIHRQVRLSYYRLCDSHNMLNAHNINLFFADYV